MKTDEEIIKRWVGMKYSTLTDPERIRLIDILENWKLVNKELSEWVCSPDTT